MKKLNRCEYEGCWRKAHFALYQLKKDGTKKWVNICDEHDREIAENNASIRQLFPGIFKEVK